MGVSVRTHDPARQRKRVAEVDPAKACEGRAWVGQFPGYAPHARNPDEQLGGRGKARCRSARPQPRCKPERVHAVSGGEPASCSKSAGKKSASDVNGVHSAFTFQAGAVSYSFLWSGRPGSNRRHSAWEADVPFVRFLHLVSNQELTS